MPCQSWDFFKQEWEVMKQIMKACLKQGIMTEQTVNANAMLTPQSFCDWKVQQPKNSVTLHFMFISFNELNQTTNDNISEHQNKNSSILKKTYYQINTWYWFYCFSIACCCCKFSISKDDHLNFSRSEKLYKLHSPLCCSKVNLRTTRN